MSVNTKFEAHKIQREIQRSGKEFKFYRPQKNDVGELIPINSEIEPTKEIKGVYHEVNQHVQFLQNQTTQTRVRQKKQPAILCLFEDTEGLKIDDVVFINDKTFVVVSLNDIQEWNIIADISLEVFDSGNHVSL